MFELIKSLNSCAEIVLIEIEFILFICFVVFHDCGWNHMHFASKRFKSMQRPSIPSHTVAWLHLITAGICKASAISGISAFLNRNSAKHSSSLNSSRSHFGRNHMANLSFASCKTDTATRNHRHYLKNLPKLKRHVVNKMSL